MNAENEILYNQIYERTKEFGRAHFIKEIMRLERENSQLKEMVNHEHKYGSEMEGKYILEREKNKKAIEYIENADWYLPLWECRDNQPDKNILLEILKDSDVDE